MRIENADEEEERLVDIEEDDDGGNRNGRDSGECANEDTYKDAHVVAHDNFVDGEGANGSMVAILATHMK